ncbi:hypothetical protein L1049_022222 [Liquidambar formosana]|uniref:Uncharacterized protein n=1 Tax=Liquidambar formosana TaxID=63359 RepID=A0AAP0RC45_LIQFO
MRNKMRDFKDAAALVLSEDGSSTKSLAEVAQTRMNQKTLRLQWRFLSNQPHSIARHVYYQ